MSVKRFQREHNGVAYSGVEDRDRKVTGSITNGDKKWTLKGYPKINRTKGSYKHGAEVQITIWEKAGTTFEKDRVPYATNWDTVEVFFPPEVWHDLIREYVIYMKEEEGVASVKEKLWDLIMEAQSMALTPYEVEEKLNMILGGQNGQAEAQGLQVG